MAGKFVTRELTVKEMVLCCKVSKGDFEAVVALVESRLAEPIVDLQEMSSSEFSLLVQECSASIEQATEQTAKLTAILMSK